MVTGETGADTRYARAEIVDELDDGDRTMILLEHTAQLLSPVASAAWRALDRPRTAGELTELLEAEFGAPESGSTLAAVSAVLDELERVGTVIRPR